MAKLKFNMQDWRCEGVNIDPADKVDTAKWPVEIKTHRYAITVIATAPDGGNREVWIEISDGHLVAHCYDADHDEPLNVRIGKGDIATDHDDREDITHG